MEKSARYRFPKRHRLLDASAYDRVFAKARRSRDRYFTVLCRRNHLKYARLGLAVAKKQCRKASRRNQIKRIVRESFRQHQKNLAGLDVVVMNRAAAVDADGRALRVALAAHWQRCKTLLASGTRNG